MTPLESARQLLQDSLIHLNGDPVGTAATRDPSPAAENYEECFIRDFFPSALVFLNDGQPAVVKNFLVTVLKLRFQQSTLSGHEIHPGVMPASFRVTADGPGEEQLVADFGDRAIGRVAPVDSMMWWTLLLGAYTRSTGDQALAASDDIQHGLKLVLQLALQDTFEVYPTLLVPDASFMIDRRLGVYGHPLEVQALFYGVLQTALELLKPEKANQDLIQTALNRQKVLRSYIRIFYWLDLARLNEIHRFGTEEFGTGSVNMLNVYPESIPDWVADWLPDDGGYLVGNLGPGRMDFRFFAQGNLLAILFGLTTEEQAQKIMTLYEECWDQLVGAMPVKICYPALQGEDWEIQTGSDPKNAPWSYHNGGNWPVLLWPFVAAALRAERRDLAQKALDLAGSRLLKDQWPEYYDGKRGRLLGRRANLRQTWSATAYIFSHQLLAENQGLALFPGQATPGSKGV